MQFMLAREIWTSKGSENEWASKGGQQQAAAAEKTMLKNVVAFSIWSEKERVHAIRVGKWHKNACFIGLKDEK